MRNTIGEAKQTPAPRDSDSLAEVLPGEPRSRRDLFDRATIRAICLTPEGGRRDEPTVDDLLTDDPNGFWLLPATWDVNSARSAARQGIAAAVLVAVVNLVIAVLIDGGIEPFSGLGVRPESAIIGSAIYVAIACGIFAMSRVAAVLGLLLYVVDRSMTWSMSYPSVGGIIISVVLALMFANAVRGTFAYREFTRVRSAPRSDDE